MPGHKANVDHLMLAKIVRVVHRDLRKLYKHNVNQDGINFRCEDDLWSEHCNKEDVLARYAEAMHRLASIHWTDNNASTRIEWCYAIVKEYFQDGGVNRELQRYGRRLRLADCRPQNGFWDPSRKIRLLDVGSCYNPFGVYDDLDVLGIDLHPATKEVRKCDFINLKIASNEYEEEGEEEDGGDRENSMPSTGAGIIERLDAKHFDVIVFSLLLEYLPSVNQRLRCFVNASALLREHGLLLVVTPDSKHRTRNAAMIKSWRLCLETLGFYRIRYEKQTHLHCMAFIKVVHDLNTTLDDGGALKKEVTGDTGLARMLYIPQDFQEFDDDRDDEADLIEPVFRTTDEDDKIAETFSHLPKPI